MADGTDPTQPAAPAQTPPVDSAPQPAQELAPAAPAPDPAVTDPTVPPVGPAPVPVASSGIPASSPPATSPEPQVTPDPSVGPTPTTSPDPSAAPAGDPAPVAVPAPAVVPVTVDNRTKRDDDDALEGGWVDVVEGPYAGRYGAYVSNLSHGEDGYPEVILVRTRDASNELVEVEYAHTRPSERTGGR